MREFILGLLCLVVFTTRVRALDLTISAPEVVGLEVSVSASLSANSNYYLQGTLRSQSSSKYFGETLNKQGSWIDYLSSPDKEYVTSSFFLTDIQDSTWSGKINIRYKVDDPNYFGPGLYDLKLRRFTGNSSSSAGDSNTLTIALSEPLPTSSPTQAPVSPTPDSTKATTPTQTPVITPSPSPLLSALPTLSPSSVATVAGAKAEINLTGFGVSTSSPSAHPESGSSISKPSLNWDRLKTVLLVGFGLVILATATYFGYLKYRLNRTIT